MRLLWLQSRICQQLEDRRGRRGHSLQCGTGCRLIQGKLTNLAELNVVLSVLSLVSRRRRLFLLAELLSLKLLDRFSVWRVHCSWRKDVLNFSPNLCYTSLLITCPPAHRHIILLSCITTECVCELLGHYKYQHARRWGKQQCVQLGWFLDEKCWCMYVFMCVYMYTVYIHCVCVFVYCACVCAYTV